MLSLAPRPRRTCSPAPPARSSAPARRWRRRVRRLPRRLPPRGRRPLLLGTALRRELVRHVDECPQCRRAAERAMAGVSWPGTAPAAAALAVLEAPAPRGARRRRAGPPGARPAHPALRPHGLPARRQGPRRAPRPAAQQGPDDHRRRHGAGGARARALGRLPRRAGHRRAPGGPFRLRRRGEEPGENGDSGGTGLDSLDSPPFEKAGRVGQFRRQSLGQGRLELTRRHGVGRRRRDRAPRRRHPHHPTGARPPHGRGPAAG